MMDKESGVMPKTGLVAVNKLFGVAGHRGIGMLEFVIALLIFSMGMMGLLSAQLAGKKAGYEAAQRSIATALVRDMLERIRANPGQISAYQVTDAGDTSHRVPLPDVDCDATECSAVQLATFDIWQWESLLLGASEQLSGVYAGGLVAPRACIASDAGEVAVTISWLDATPSQKAIAANCGGEIEHHTPHQHQLTVSTFIEPH
jgi:type IV pilus assembly protein PilV